MIALSDTSTMRASTLVVDVRESLLMSRHPEAKSALRRRRDVGLPHEALADEDRYERRPWRAARDRRA